MAGPIYFYNNGLISGGGSNPVLDVIQIGTPSSQTADFIPFYSYWEWGRSHHIIEPSAIGKAGAIQAVEWAMSGPASPTSHLSPRQNVYMGHFPLQSSGYYRFPSTTAYWDLTQYYSVSGWIKTFGVGTGDDVTWAMGKTDPTWVKLDMGVGSGVNQFNYNGTDALVISYENRQDPEWTYTSDVIDWYTRTKTYQSAYNFGSGLSSSLTRTSIQPIIKLHVFG